MPAIENEEIRKRFNAAVKEALAEDRAAEEAAAKAKTGDKPASDKPASSGKSGWDQFMEFCFGTDGAKK